MSARFWIKDLILLSLCLSIFFGLFLGSRPLSVPDEARYAEIPREMLVTGDFLTPHLNTIKYFEKPPLFYWMQAASLKTFGINEWGARLPNALIALFGCLVTYAAARALYCRKTGWFASLILASTLLYDAMAHIVTLDMTISVFLSAALFCLLIGVQQPPSYRRRLLCYGFCVSTALAVLAKGLIGILFPAGIILLWIILTRPKQLRPLYFPSGLLIFLAIALPWHILVQIKNPEFFNFYFIDQHFLRYLTNYASRYQPIWFFIIVILIGFLPWTFALIQALYKSEKNPIFYFLLIWALVVFTFFSLSHSKLIPYILPIFPPLAVITAAYWIQHRLSQKLFWILLSISLATWTILIINLPHFDQRSIKSLALLIKANAQPTDYIISFQHYYQDLPFYLQQPVTLIGSYGELDFGIKHTNPLTQLPIMDQSTFIKLWNTKQRMWIILPERNYEQLEPLLKTNRVIGKTSTNILLANF